MRRRRLAIAAANLPPHRIGPIMPKVLALRAGW
jgi:hypothetical protein